MLCALPNQQRKSGYPMQMITDCHTFTEHAVRYLCRVLRKLESPSINHRMRKDPPRLPSISSPLVPSAREKCRPIPSYHGFFSAH